ncbi:hypothetical protein HA050_08995 [Iodobacter sp. HSC-16F04]|uniref:Uncharacterized protein n=1 Tax=Iodobacter violaceini TaxID=3044271 RepID=A0ABX0KYV4_9NEIS|nr:hypothetical protein [Iodobacter violacea]NHQ86251.1 hypothetical protein [Iodobacter violacea]
MAFTPIQFNRFKDHPNLEWLRRHAASSRAIHQNTIRVKIEEAIRSAYPDRATEDNIRWVAQKTDTPWGSPYRPAEQSLGLVHQQAAAEIEGNDAQMAQAVRMVFNKTADGRSAPGTSGINHIHVGGNAQLNLLFDLASATILGVVNGHMDGQMKPAIRTESAKVASRKGGPAIQMKVSGNTVSRA